VDVQELAPGLWRWTTPHPDWREDADWEADVSSVYLETAGHVVLIDPLVPTDDESRERFLHHLDADVERAGKPVAVLVTVYWHERSAAELAKRYGGEIWASEGTAAELQAPARVFSPGDVLPGGVIAVDALRRFETIYWLPEHRALVTGDVLLGDAEQGVRVCPDSWLPDGASPAEFRLALQALLDLPVELILPAHGAPVRDDAHAVLRRALDPQAVP